MHHLLALQLAQESGHVGTHDADATSIAPSLPSWSSCSPGGRELRGIGPGIEARLREYVETDEIAELAMLERRLAPDLVGLGR